MYAYLNGRLASLEPAYAVLDVNGIGFFVKIPLTTYEELRATSAIGKEAKLYTHLHVTEDAHTLFGFAAEEDRIIFQTLLTANGVGPGTALQALSQMRGRDLAQAIMTGNATALTRIKGLGAKTAQKIVLDLKTRMLKTLSLDPTANAAVPTAGPASHRSEALQALTLLGLGKAQAEKILDTLLEENADMTVEELIRQALKRK